jgi:AcrR family transcriptional regulator
MKKNDLTDEQLPKQPGAERPIRDRVLGAAFGLFCERGFAATSMLDIATRAQVSKRDLYALFANKHDLLAQCIEDRAQRMRRPLGPESAVPRSRRALMAKLVEMGTAVLQTGCRPEVLTVYRLAIAESDRAPEIAHGIHANEEAIRRALADLLAQASELGLVRASDPSALAARFFMVLWDDMLVRLLMRVCEPPTAEEIKARSQAAAAAIFEPGRR